MARKKSHLVCQHLEGISAAVLDQYQDIIRDYIRGRHGIYALYKRGHLYYIGLASNLYRRLNKHLRDRHKGSWDRFSVYLTIENHHIKELESLFLRIFIPKGNLQSGKFPKSEDLKNRLLRDINGRQRDELQVLTGKKPRVSKRKSTKSRARKEKSETSLGPYVARRIPIRARFKGTLYKATIRSSGWIYYEGYLYASPSALASEICGRRESGWKFWEYQRAPGDWVTLGSLRK